MYRRNDILSQERNGLLELYNVYVRTYLNLQSDECDCANDQGTIRPCDELLQFVNKIIYEGGCRALEESRHTNRVHDNAVNSIVSPTEERRGSVDFT